MYLYKLVRAKIISTAEKNVDSGLAGSTTSVLHPLKTEKHVIADGAKHWQVGNGLINSV
jgi:hypothetical protein